jgi:hypothetical protein
VRYILTVFIFIYSALANASNTETDLNAQIKEISQLYNDGYATFLPNTIRSKVVIDVKTGSCVKMATFFMEGFTQGNNISQFVVFFRCKKVNGDYDTDYKHKESVTGVFPIALFKNSLDLNTAAYSSMNTISIKSKSGNKVIDFHHTGRWWQQKQQIGLFTKY